MTKQVQRRRGTAAQHTGFTGAEGELSVNTTTNTVHVHDGVTAGGTPLARADLTNVTGSNILSAAGVTATAAELNFSSGVTSAIQTQLNAKAPINNATFTGTTVIPTADINGGAIDGVTIGASAAPTVTNIDINGGTIDGTVIGGSTPAAISGTTGSFSGNLTVDTNTLFVDAASNRVGIGTSSPSNLLHVSAGQAIVKIGSTTTSAGNAPRLLLEHAGNNTYQISGGSDLIFSSDAGTNERMRVNNAGNVGIGTSSPASDALLTLGSAQGTSQSIFLNGFGADNESAITNTNGNLIFSNGAGTTVAALTERMRITSTGSVQIGTSSGSTNKLLAFDDSAESVIFVRQNGAGPIQSWHGAGAAERMRITSTGFVGIGTTNPAQRLEVAGNQLFQNNNEIRFKASGGTQHTALTLDSSNNLKVGTSANGALIFINGSSYTERARIDASGNLLVAGTGTPTSSAGNLVIYNGTAPTGNATNGVILYAEDVSASSELKVRDEAGNVTTLSPHNFDLIPEGPSEDMAWSYYSERDGKRINVDMLKAIRLLEQISGEKLVHMV